VTPGSLPTGLSIAIQGTSSCRISGTPTAAGTFTFNVVVSEGSTTANRVYTVVIESPITINTASPLTDAVQNAAYSPGVTLTASGGVAGGTQSWSTAPGAGFADDPECAGFTLSAGGVVGGTPTVAGTCTFTARVSIDDPANGTSPDPATKDKVFNITVLAQLTITSGPTLLDAVDNRAYSLALASTGGSGGALTWGTTAGNGPIVLNAGDAECNGLSISAAGVITGTPDTPGTCSFTVRLTDAGNAAVGSFFVDKAMTIEVQPEPSVTSGPALADGIFGRGYTLTLSATGGTGTLTFAEVTGSTLADDTDCDGLSLAANGQLSGTPDGLTPVDNVCSFSVEVSDAGNAATSGGTSAAAALTIDLNTADLALVTPTIVNALVSSSYNSGTGITFSSTGGLAPVQYSLTGGGFSCNGTTCTSSTAACNGFSLNQTSGVLSGNPTTAGTCSFVANVTDDIGNVNPAVAGVTDSSGTLDIEVLGTFAYVAAPGNAGTGGVDTVEVINTTSNTLVTSIDLNTAGDEPHSVAVTPEGTKAFVTLNGAGGVAVIDTTNNTLTGTIDVDDGVTANCANPKGIAIAQVASLGSTLAYVACEGGEVVIINTGSETVVTSITLTTAADLDGVAFSPDGTRVYVTSSVNNDLSIIDADNTVELDTDGAGGVNSFALDATRTTPRGIAVVANGAKLYAYIAKENPGGATVGAVEVVDVTTDTLAAVVTRDTGADSSPLAVTVNPDGNRVYATLSESGQFVVLNNTADPPTVVGGTPLIANQATITDVERLTSVSTITTATDHGFLSGQTVVIAGTTADGGSFNGTFVIVSTPTGTTFTYAQVLADVTSTADTGTASVNANPAGVTIPPGASRAYISLFGGFSIAIQNDASPFAKAAPPIVLTTTATPQGIAHIPIPK
jgi:DNA-binding beta-propeller fold protein YncE